MKKTITLLLLACLTFSVNAQSMKQAEKALKKVKSLEELEALKKKYPDWDISTDITLYSAGGRFPEVLKARIGDVITKQYNPKAPSFALKVLKVEELELCKAKYIYLNGKEMSMTKIDSIRAVIIERYQQGEDFEELVKEYNMDGNPTGDLPWFYKGMMVEEFDDAVRQRTKGELFTINVEGNQWYYVVLKTEDNKMENAVMGIKIMLQL